MRIRDQEQKGEEEGGGGSSVKRMRLREGGERTSIRVKR